MIYSLNLLKKYINTYLSPEELSDLINEKIFKVNRLRSRIIPEEVVIGKVLELAQHPNADKLTVVQVDCGRYGTNQILCGGQNLKVGSYVPVALTGCYLPELKVTIESRDIRGEESNGMICSKEELGIKEDIDKHRIRNLGEDFNDLSDDDLGTRFVSKYPWLENHMFEIIDNQIRNKPELAGHFGLAMELNNILSDDKQSILFNKIPEYIDSFENTNIKEMCESASKSDISLKNELEFINSALLLEVESLAYQKSTFYTRLLLYDIGSKPSNNINDFTNLVSSLLGYKIYVFDKSKISGSIWLRNADNGEKININDKQFDLENGDGVIADNKGVLGLIGLQASTKDLIDRATNSIVLLALNFDQKDIMDTAHRLKLKKSLGIKFDKTVTSKFMMNLSLVLLDEIKYMFLDLDDPKVRGMDYFVKGGEEL